MKGKKPYVPDINCPYIDRTISLINTMVEVEDVEWRREMAKLIHAHLEFIRESNSTLREVGKFWYERSKKR